MNETPEFSISGSSGRVVARFVGGSWIESDSVEAHLLHAILLELRRMNEPEIRIEHRPIDLSGLGGGGRDG